MQLMYQRIYRPNLNKTNEREYATRNSFTALNMEIKRFAT